MANVRESKYTIYQKLLKDFTNYLNTQSVKNDDIRWAYNDCLEWFKKYTQN